MNIFIKYKNTVHHIPKDNETYVKFVLPKAVKAFLLISI